ncbi:MAG: phosphatidylserine decarboxylase, partial [Bradyrhizobiaceae bacterium]|nr:phosphatidylserine decarboxylase [Bradyrhizobiaceae bacterium]
MRSVINRLTQQEDLNFLLTNRIPKRLATRFMGWFTHIEQPVVRDVSIATWRFFSDVDLSDAEKKQFASLH